MPQWIVWPATFGLIALAMGLLVYMICFAVADWKESRELQARLAEQHREKTDFSLGLQRTIREGRNGRSISQAARSQRCL